MGAGGDVVLLERVRVLRALVVCVLAAGLGGLGHAALGGGMSGLALAAALALTFPLAFRAAGCECSLLRIAALLALGQMVVHGAAALAAFGAHVAAPGSTELDVGALVCGIHGSAGASHGSHGILAMLAVHGLATAIAALWLRHGERLVWRGLRAATALVARLVAPRRRRRAALPSVALPPRAAAAPRRSALAAGWSRRGPPRIVVA